MASWEKGSGSRSSGQELSSGRGLSGGGQGGGRMAEQRGPGRRTAEDRSCEWWQASGVVVRGTNSDWQGAERAAGGSGSRGPAAADGEKQPAGSEAGDLQRPAGRSGRWGSRNL
ncbi:uncharacterized protein LOC131031583 [Cryptomeria japonica]|uniref:uncharacterized protein LOC131031583 n=1 Tax=Cryptomeria japonica TaxID=3369 RepID=UPI0027D9F555|nr:uncharacterized protein LOC131031583 [Cryptomeria japonica]